MAKPDNIFSNIADTIKKFIGSKDESILVRLRNFFQSIANRLDKKIGKQDAPRKSQRIFPRDIFINIQTDLDGKDKFFLNGIRIGADGTPTEMGVPYTDVSFIGSEKTKREYFLPEEAEKITSHAWFAEVEGLLKQTIKSLSTVYNSRSEALNLCAETQKFFECMKAYAKGELYCSRGLSREKYSSDIAPLLSKDDMVLVPNTFNKVSASTFSSEGLHTLLDKLKKTAPSTEALIYKTKDILARSLLKPTPNLEFSLN